MNRFDLRKRALQNIVVAIVSTPLIMSAQAKGYQSIASVLFFATLAFLVVRGGFFAGLALWWKDIHTVGDLKDSSNEIQREIDALKQKKGQGENQE
jgi:hypothetical protein